CNTSADESCPLCVNCIVDLQNEVTIQMLLTPKFAYMTRVDTKYYTHFPSGKNCGSAIRCNLIMSSKVMACFDDSCAQMACPDPSSIALAKRHLKITLFILLLLL